MKRTRNTVAKQIFACGNSIHKVAFSAVMIQLYVQAVVLHQYSKISTNDNYVNTLKKF